MPEFMIAGIPVMFPFKPYDLQINYMAKVIECLENSTHGVLESPTGTGKTLSLLCSTLAWLTKKKAEAHANVKASMSELEQYKNENGSVDTGDLPLMKSLAKNFRETIENHVNAGRVPKVIYASRTHSQLAQAMQELKRSDYGHIKAAIIGSREQLCIHTDVMKETTNSGKIHMCKLKVTTRSCSFYHRVEKSKDHPDFTQSSVLDIEDLVRVGRKLKCCPYFTSKELILNADIVFMPYNYILDPKTRNANKVDLNNTIVILDEAHNVEKMCEDSASIQLASSDIAIAIEDVNFIMKQMTDDNGQNMDRDGASDFTIDDVVLLKEMFLELEKAVDAIDLKNSIEGITLPGIYIFDLLQKANIRIDNEGLIIKLLDDLVQYLTTASDENSMFRRGGGLQKVQDLLTIVFSCKGEGYLDKIGKCYKVHVEVEQQKSTKVNTTTADGWHQPKAKTLLKTTAKIVSYWCFSPNFGMQQILDKNVRSIILTSGTLAPLKPLIAELGIPISVRLENPHIVTKSQVCVKIVSAGPDKEPLISNFQNRDNPAYISSLGRTILSLCPVTPDGMLIFFTSYSILNKYKDIWQASGIWSSIGRIKQIFIEPHSKEAFVEAMNDYYAKINDPSSRGAIFMAVFRGKVSEGLDFADTNGRSVIITGLPFPPFKDPRIILKKKYLSDNRTKQNEMLSGDEWYFLEATRAVNQAIGRVIRHKNDYGAIILCDHRFHQPKQKQQLSSWIQGHLNGQQQHTTFGPLIGEISRFFKNAERTLPQPSLKPLDATLDASNDVKPTTFIKYEPQQTVSYSMASTSSSNYRNATMSKHIKIENSNEVIGWDPSIYEKPNVSVMASSSQHSKTSSQASSGSSSFFSALNKQVSTIDFNTPLVTIHKRERTSPLFSRDSKTVDLTISPPSSIALGNLAKKRKFKLIPNDFGEIKTEPLVTSSIPNDRKELLKLLKSSLSPPHYGLFIKSLTVYQKDGALEDLIATFCEIFNQPNFHYLFRGMRRFIKDAHKDRFDECITTLI